MGNEKQPFL